MQPHLMSKYRLKDLHQEIDFFDRKIAYCEQHEKFETENDRAVALQKLRTKRETLVKAALELTSKGVEYDPRQLPRSFRNQSLSSAKAA